MYTPIAVKIVDRMSIEDLGIKIGIGELVRQTPFIEHITYR